MLHILAIIICIPFIPISNVVDGHDSWLEIASSDYRGTTVDYVGAENTIFALQMSELF